MLPFHMWMSQQYAVPKVKEPEVVKDDINYAAKHRLEAFRATIALKGTPTNVQEVISAYMRYRRFLEGDKFSIKLINAKSDQEHVEFWENLKQFVEKENKYEN